MQKFDPDVNTSAVNAILRRLNNDEDFKINFTEFGQNITPTLQGFTEAGCITHKPPLEIPDKETSDDVLPQSKFLDMLEHDGLGFNIDKKKQILRDIEISKTQVRGGKNEKNVQCMLRNFKQIYE